MKASHNVFTSQLPSISMKEIGIRNHAGRMVIPFSFSFTHALPVDKHICEFSAIGLIRWGEIGKSISMVDL